MGLWGDGAVCGSGRFWGPVGVLGVRVFLGGVSSLSRFGASDGAASAFIGTGAGLIGALLGFMGPERDLSGLYWGLWDRTGTYRGSIGVYWTGAGLIGVPSGFCGGSVEILWGFIGSRCFGGPGGSRRSLRPTRDWGARGPRAQRSAPLCGEQCGAGGDRPTEPPHSVPVPLCVRRCPAPRGGGGGGCAALQLRAAFGRQRPLLGGAAGGHRGAGSPSDPIAPRVTP